MIRLALIIDDLDRGGAQRQLVELAKALPRARYAVHVIALSADRLAYAQELRQAGIEVTAIARHGKWSWTTFLRVLAALRRVRPHIVQTWLFTANLYGRLAAWLSRVPVITSAVRSVEPDKRPHYVAVDRLLRRVTRAYTVNARAVGETLAARERVHPDRIQVIYNGVNLSELDPARWNGEVRRELSLDERAPVVGAIGRLVPVKDYATFLHAAARVAHRVPSAQFVICGSGPLRTTLQSLARSLGIAAQVQILSSRRDVAAVLATLDVVVVSSRYEGCSNVILEAMAMGKPVVATNVGGNPELINDGRTGCLVPPQDPERLAQAVIRLLEDAPHARRMGAQGRQLIESRFQLKRMVEETDAFYLRQLQQATGAAWSS